MKTNLLRILPILFVAAIFSSCSTSSDLSSNSIVKKRKYTKGYHVDFRQKNEKKSADVFVAEIKPNVINDSKPESHHVQSLDMSASTTAKITEADLTARAIPVKTTGTSKKMDNQDLTNSKTPIAATSMKEAKRDLRNSMRESRKEMKSSSSSAGLQDESLILYVILAILIPPLAVGLLYGIGTEFWISLVLTLLFFVPGVIYALIKVFSH